MHRAACAALLVGLVACAWPSGWRRAADALAPETSRRAPLLDGIGRRPFAITTRSPEARLYFEQGLALSYAFNHAEAARSFREAARLDPECPMAFWGLALVLGPNINAGMEAGDEAEARQAIGRARELAPGASERERAFVAALEKRYAVADPAARGALDLAYADAMREVARSHPRDVDALVLFAEAVMDAHAWDYWEPGGAPRPWTPELLATLDAALLLDPLHPGANHFCIHALEASKEPARGLPCAERLGALAPAAGHLVHMPSHIYIRVGRYHEGSLANERAIEADRSYLTQCRQQGLYPLAYAPHNQHFLWATATLEGASAKALSAAHHTSAMADPEEMREHGMGMLQHFASIPDFARVRFGRWEEILAQPAPDEDLAWLRAVHHYARGMALARSGHPAQAMPELAALEAAAADPALAEVAPWGGNAAPDLIRIGVHALAGEIAAARREWGEAVAQLAEAVRLEDALRYNEPPDWFFPVRQSLGAVLLEAGRPSEAERVYREDLLEFPENGWSLFGLRQSLEAQGRAADARDAARRFAEAWRYADIELPGSRF